MRFRDKAEVERFFDGLKPVGPGIVPVQRWFPEEGGTPASGAVPETVSDADVGLWAGVAVKP